MDAKPLQVIVTAAFVGGVVSIATRMREFTRIRDLDPFAMFWTAMLKPLIGATLSVFLFATLAGGVVSFGFLPEDPFALKAAENATGVVKATENATGVVKAAENAIGAEKPPENAIGDQQALDATDTHHTIAEKTLYVLWVLGFLAGFSERFAWDFVDRTQGVASGGLGGDR